MIMDDPAWHARVAAVNSGNISGTFEEKFEGKFDGKFEGKFEERSISATTGKNIANRLSLGDALLTNYSAVMVKWAIFDLDTLAPTLMQAIGSESAVSSNVHGAQVYS
jgi:hypothetical protein